MKYTYLLINIATILFPLLASFERKVAYARKWAALFPAMALTATLFLAWDAWFTEQDIWHFNPDYVLGVYIAGMPVEEWMFFFCIPFAVVFIYEVLIYAYPELIPMHTSRGVFITLIPILIVIGFIYIDRAYTATAFFFAAALLIIHVFLLKSKWLNTFLLMYLVQLLPFFIVNGLLTALPVVLYNDSETLGFRLYTIPVEDTIYDLSLLLLNISLYERFKQAGFAINWLPKHKSLL